MKRLFRKTAAFRSRAAFTLIELIVVVGVSGILTTAIFAMFDAAVQSYHQASASTFLSRAADDILQEVGGSGYEAYGIRDAVEILEITSSSIKFLPLWVDDSQTVLAGHTAAGTLAANPFTLNKPVRVGAGTPVVEVYDPATRSSITLLASFNAATNQVTLMEPVADTTREIRFIFYPAESVEDDCAVNISYDAQTGRISRTYRGEVETIPQQIANNIFVSSFLMTYFDYTGAAIPASNDQIPNIAGVRIQIRDLLLNPGQAFPPTEEQVATLSYWDANAFMTVRNIRFVGQGKILREGTSIEIPGSADIRMLSLANMTGITAGGEIEIEAASSGSIWLVRFVFDVGADGDPIIKTYTVEYPKGTQVLSQTVNVDCSYTFDLLEQTATGRYDTVELDGPVTMTVTKMQDVSGAVLFIRP